MVYRREEKRELTAFARVPSVQREDDASRRDAASDAPSSRRYDDVTVRGDGDAAAGVLIPHVFFVTKLRNGNCVDNPCWTSVPQKLLSDVCASALSLTKLRKRCLRKLWRALCLL